jgi:hypothetical protein
MVEKYCIMILSILKGPHWKHDGGWTVGACYVRGEINCTAFAIGPRNYVVFYARELIEYWLNKGFWPNSKLAYSTVKEKKYFKPKSSVFTNHEKDKYFPFISTLGHKLNLWVNYSFSIITRNI